MNAGFLQSPVRIQQPRANDARVRMALERIQHVVNCTWEEFGVRVEKQDKFSFHTTESQIVASPKDIASL